MRNIFLLNAARRIFNGYDRFELLLLLRLFDGTPPREQMHYKSHLRKSRVKASGSPQMIAG